MEGNRKEKKRKEPCRKCGRTVEAQCKTVEISFGIITWGTKPSRKPAVWWFECECGHAWETPQG